MNYKKKLAGLLLSTAAVIPALLPGAAFANEVTVEVAGVQTSPAGEVVVCTYDLNNPTTQVCYIRPAAIVNDGSEVAGVQLNPDAAPLVEVAGVQLTPAGPIVTCSYDLNSSRTQVCLIPLG